MAERPTDHQPPLPTSCRHPAGGRPVRRCKRRVGQTRRSGDWPNGRYPHDTRMIPASGYAPIADIQYDRHSDPMKNILIVDGATNATFSVFQATDTEFATLFPNGEEIDVIEDVVERVGNAGADEIFVRIWERPVLKSEAHGIHATLIYDDPSRRDHLPPSRREVDWNESSINEAQRRLFRSRR